MEYLSEILQLALDSVNSFSDIEKLLETQFGKIMRFMKEIGNSCVTLENVQAKNWELLFREKCWEF